MDAGAIFTFFYSAFGKISIWPLGITGMGFVQCIHVITDVIFTSVNNKKLLVWIFFFSPLELRKQFIFNSLKHAVQETRVIQHVQLLYSSQLFVLSHDLHVKWQVSSFLPYGIVTAQSLAVKFVHIPFSTKFRIFQIGQKYLMFWVFEKNKRQLNMSAAVPTCS